MKENKAAEHLLPLLQRDSLVTHDTIREVLGLREPRIDEFTHHHEFKAAWQAYQFAYLQGVEGVREYLLENHKVAIANVRGDGYRVVPPAEQTSYAMRTGTDAIRRELLRVRSLLEHVRTEELSDAQRKENLDAAARVAVLRQMHRQAA